MTHWLLFLLLSADGQEVPGRPPHECDARVFYRDDRIVNFEREVFFEGRGFTQDELGELAGTLLRARSVVTGLGFPVDFPWGIRTYHSEDYGDPVNSYSIATTVTFRTPCPRLLLEGGLGLYDPVTDLFDRLVELHWTRSMRPVDGLPMAAREAVNRYFSRRLRERLGDPAEWWPGGARPREEALRNLGPDHPLVQDRDRILDLLERRTQQLGTQMLLAQGGVPSPENEARLQELGLRAVLDAMNGWGSLQLTGAQTWPPFSQFLQSAAGDEPILPPIVWDLRVPFGEETGPAQRLLGLEGRPEQASGMRFQYGDQPDLATHYLSVKEGAPTTWYQMPAEGMYRLSEVELLARRTGPFTDETFDVVVLDPAFREMSRWTYPIHVFEETSTTPQWLVFSFDSLPFLPTGCFVALDFPRLGEDQDVELAVRWGETGDHSFQSEPGRSIRSLPQAGAWAMTIQVNARSVEGRGAMERLLLELLARANGR